MKIIIHDLTEDVLQGNLPQISDDDIVISDNGSIHPCIGCFGCWLKTPGVCIIRDEYQQMGRNIASCSEMLIISKCKYGVTDKEKEIARKLVKANSINFYAQDILAERVSRQETGENFFISLNFPRFLYKMAAQMGWRQAIKKNGLKTRDLWNKQI